MKNIKYLYIILGVYIIALFGIYYCKNVIKNPYYGYNQNAFIRKKTAKIYETGCISDNVSELKAGIANNNLVFYYNSKAIELINLDVKYVLFSSKESCHEGDIYYITNDNNLYSIKIPSINSNTELAIDYDQVKPSLIQKNVLEFICKKEYKNRFVIEVLLSNGKTKEVLVR